MVKEHFLYDADVDGDIDIAYRYLNDIKIRYQDNLVFDSLEVLNIPLQQVFYFEIGDFNNDDLIDILIEGDDTLGILYQNYSSTFDQFEVLNTYLFNELDGVNSVDINEDGFLDIVTFNKHHTFSSDSVFIYLQNMQGEFIKTVAFPSSSRVKNIRYMDIDDDGYKDILANQSENNDDLLLFKQVDNMVFQEKVFPCGSGCSGRRISFADFNYDMKLDLVYLNRLTNELEIRFQDLDTFSFTTVLTLETPNNIINETDLVDIDCNGYLDIITNDFASDELLIYLQTDYMVFEDTAIASIGSNLNYNSLSIADLNDDGLDDVFLTSFNEFSYHVNTPIFSDESSIPLDTLISLTGYIDTLEIETFSIDSIYISDSICSIVRIVDYSIETSEYIYYSNIDSIFSFQNTMCESNFFINDTISITVVDSIVVFMDTTILGDYVDTLSIRSEEHVTIIDTILLNQSVQSQFLVVMDTISEVELLIDSFLVSDSIFDYRITTIKRNLIETITCNDTVRSVIFLGQSMSNFSTFSSDTTLHSSTVVLISLIDKLNTNKLVSVFPNPSNGELFINSSIESIKRLMIFDLQGNIIDSIPEKELMERINIENSGLYIFHFIFDNDSHRSLKVIVR